MDRTSADPTVKVIFKARDSDLEDDQKGILPVNSNFTSRKSSAQANSNDLSVQLQQGQFDQKASLMLEAKKSSKNIINTMARGEYVAIQQLRIRTNRILHMISKMGNTKSC